MGKQAAERAAAEAYRESERQKAEAAKAAAAEASAKSSREDGSGKKAAAAAKRAATAAARAAKSTYAYAQYQAKAEIERGKKASEKESAPLLLTTDVITEGGLRLHSVAGWVKLVGGGDRSERGVCVCVCA